MSFTSSTGRVNPDSPGINAELRCVGCGVSQPIIIHPNYFVSEGGSDTPGYSRIGFGLIDLRGEFAGGDWKHCRTCYVAYINECRRVNAEEAAAAKAKREVALAAAIAEGPAAIGSMIAQLSKRGDGCYRNLVDEADILRLTEALASGATTA